MVNVLVTCQILLHYIVLSYATLHCCDALLLRYCNALNYTIQHYDSVIANAITITLHRPIAVHIMSSFFRNDWADILDRAVTNDAYANLAGAGGWNDPVRMCSCTTQRVCKKVMLECVGHA